MMTEDNFESRAALADALNRAYAIGGDYVTQQQLTTEIKHLETKISAAEDRMQKWVLAGVIAIVMAFGGGYVSLVSKLDRLSEAMPNVTQVLDGRHSWILRKDMRDDGQDGAIKIAVPSYKPAPYVEPPK